MTKAIPARAEFRGAENDRTIVVILNDENFTNISQALEGQKPVEASLRVKTLTPLNNKYPSAFAFSPILIDIKIGEIKVTGFVTGPVPIDCDNNVKFEFCSEQDPTRTICADSRLSTDQTRSHLQQCEGYRRNVGMEHQRLSQAPAQGRSFNMGIGV
jgi:hypothetical protein